MMESAVLTPTMLVVDDDAVFAGRLVRGLEKRGCRAEAVGGVEEARRTLLASPALFARVLLDLRMQDGTGLSLLRWMRERHYRPATVVLTGYGSIATTEEALKLGARRYLVKPCSIEEILAAFKESSEGDDFDRDEVDHRGQTLNVPTLAQVEWDYISRVLRDEGGNVTRAARRLGLDRRSLQRRLAKPPRMV